MEKELINKLFGPPINQVLVPQSNLNLTNVLLASGLLILLYLIYHKNNVSIKNNKNNTL
tara:strand:+ start:2983 stop:3159 length:177 start_codon:yes stop_codon:yes gene_type:complete